MAVLSRRAPRKSQLSHVLVGLTVLAGLLAVLPIAAAVISTLAGSGGGPGAPRTAFATAPAGEYAVVARNGQEADLVFVVPATDPGTATEIARVPHLPGFASNGAVAPEGRRLALVVADVGTVVRPAASLYLLDLESAVLTRLATRVDHLQTPAWAPDGRTIVFTRTAESDDTVASVGVFRVAVDGGDESRVAGFERVLGVYVVGFDPGGRLITVVIDGRGSTAYRDGTETASLGPHITRDWKLSPDGKQIAFIETDTDNGVRYRSAIVSLDGSTPTGVTAQSAAADSRQELGVAWKPGAVNPTFGREQAGASGNGDVIAQAATEGFDVPLGFSQGGSRLAVQHWSGPSFSQPGNVSLQVVTDDGSRIPFSTFTRFYGWAAR